MILKISRLTQRLVQLTIGSTSYTEQDQRNEFEGKWVTESCNRESTYICEI